MSIILRTVTRTDEVNLPALGRLLGMCGPEAAQETDKLCHEIADFITAKTEAEVRWVNVQDPMWNPLRELGFFMIESPKR